MMRNAVWICTSLTGIVLVAALGSMIFGGASEHEERETSELSRIEIETFIGAAIPPEASEILSYSEAALDRIVYLKFLAPPLAVQMVLDGLPVDIELQNGVNPLASSARDDLPWWRVIALRNPAGGRVDDYDKTGKAYIVAVDKADPQSWEVYVQVYDA